MLKKRSTIGLTIILFIGIFNSFAQEKSIYNNSYLDPFITNPAYTGLEYYPSAHLSIEKQWMEFPASPVTFKLTGNSRLGNFGFYNPKGLVNKGPLKLKERIGVGAAIYKDVNGPLSNTGGILSYGYHIGLKNKSSLSFGMSLLLSNYSINTSILDPDEIDDNYLLTDNNDVFNTNFGSGVFYKRQRYFVGVSINKLLPGVSNLAEEEKIRPNYFVTTGYKFGKTNSRFIYEPSLEIKYISSEDALLDLHSKVYFNRLNWAAISISSSKKTNIQFALRVYKKVYLGYNYGFTFSKIKAVNRSLHQISLGINLGLIGVEGIRKTI